MRMSLVSILRMLTGRAGDEREYAILKEEELSILMFQRDKEKAAKR